MLSPVIPTLAFDNSKIYWKFTSENVLTLDWIDAISIRELEKIKSLGINCKSLASDIIQHFLRHAVRDGYFHADMHVEFYLSKVPARHATVEELGRPRSQRDSLVHY